MSTDKNTSIVTSEDTKENPLKKLYPPIEPYMTGEIKVDEVHTLYYEQVGNPNGKPVVVLHGGPGGGCEEYYRQFFDPAHYRVILFDQRGSGRSKPHANLVNNTTWHLVADIEKIRELVGVEKWLVFGGSWGSTLSLAYAQTHPSRVAGLVLRGIFTLRRKELEFFYQEGSSWLYPAEFEAYQKPIPEVERADMMGAYYRKLTGDDEELKQQCALAWSIWEMTTSKLMVDPTKIARAAEDSRFALAFARIECHYFVNGGFFKEDGQLVKNAHLLKNIPGVIVQGRYDLVCPAKTAHDLHKVWPESKLIYVQDAGHSMGEKGIKSQLIKACDAFKTLEY